MPPPLESENIGKTFNPLDYVVDIKGNRWSENLASEVETVEELELIASAQRKLMREAANIATNMQVNYIQVQTLLAAKLMENSDVKTPADLMDLRTEAATSPVLDGDGEEPPEDDGGNGKQSTQTGMSAVDLEDSDVEETSRGKSPQNKRPRSGSPPAAASGANRPQLLSPRSEEKGGKPADAKDARKISDERKGRQYRYRGSGYLCARMYS